MMLGISEHRDRFGHSRNDIPRVSLMSIFGFYIVEEYLSLPLESNL